MERTVRVVSDIRQDRHTARWAFMIGVWRRRNGRVRFRMTSVRSRQTKVCTASRVHHTTEYHGHSGGHARLSLPCFGQPSRCPVL